MSSFSVEGESPNSVASCLFIMSSSTVEVVETESLNSLVSFVRNSCHNDSSNKTSQCNLAVSSKLIGSQLVTTGKICLLFLKNNCINVYLAHSSCHPFPLKGSLQSLWPLLLIFLAMMIHLSKQINVTDLCLIS